MENKPSFLIEDKNEKLDFNKKIILTHQENVKILFPACLLLLAVILAVNVTNAMSAYMSIFVCVLVNLICCGAIFFCAYKLIAGEFEVRGKLRDMGKVIYGAYADQPYERALLVSAPDGLLQNVHRVRIYDMRSAAVILPDGLDVYESRVRTKYSFKGDFGKLIFDSAACKAHYENDIITYATENGNFVFRTLPKNGEGDTVQNQDGAPIKKKNVREFLQRLIPKKKSEDSERNAASEEIVNFDMKKNEDPADEDKNTDL